MATHESDMQPPDTRASAITALEAITKLQDVLTQKAQKLELDLKRIDHLIEASTVEEIEDEPESEIAIPGSKRAVGLFPSGEFLNPLSPFNEEARKRNKYLLDIHSRPMKGKELEALSDAVKKENERLAATRRSHISTLGADTPMDLLNNIEGLDWQRIAEKVSDTSPVKRTSSDCRITWVGNRHPRVNHSEWSPTELEKLYSIVTVYQQQNAAIDWVDVAMKLGGQTNRIPIDCMRHGVPRQRLIWTPETDQRLVTAVEKYGIDNWQLVARNVSKDATATQCQGRWQKSLDPNLKHGPWTEQEDGQLRKAVAGYGTSWIQVAAAVPGRTNDQCRERWLEHLNVSTEGSWKGEDDKILMDSVSELGNKWKEISKRIGHKTGSACRQRYQKLKRAKEASKEVPSVAGSSIDATIQKFLSPDGNREGSEVIPDDSPHERSQTLIETPAFSTAAGPSELGSQFENSSTTKTRPRPRRIVLPHMDNHGTEQVQPETDSAMVSHSSAGTPGHPGLLHRGRKRKAASVAPGNSDSVAAKRTHTTRSQARLPGISLKK